MSAPVKSGDVLAGKYRVERVLGEGGMGVVVAATHLHLDQRVALKFLLPEAVANPEALARFVREAKNAVRLKSEHVARIIDVGTLDSGAPYIVMEYLEGSDLGGVLEQQRVLPIPLAVDYILQACDAIAEAHALGIIHRDLKPQNLFVTRRHGTALVKVLDFGISKSTAAGDFTATRTQAVMGSPAYMSPEQMRSAKQVDARTDVWALGIVLYQAVVGRVPWDAETFTELCFKVAMDPLPPFSPTGLSANGFEEVVRRCLEKEPARRFPDVHALAVALAPYAPPSSLRLVEQIGRMQCGDEAGLHARTIIAPRADSDPPAPQMHAVPGTQPGTIQGAAGQRVTLTASGTGARRKGRIVGIVAGVGVLAGAAITAVVLAGGGTRSSSTEPAASPVRVTAPPAAASPPAPVASPLPATSPTPSPSVPPPTPVVEQAAADQGGSDTPAAGKTEKHVTAKAITKPIARIAKEHAHAATGPTAKEPQPARTKPAAPDPLSSPD